MNLRFVETFLWVVRLGSITRAAERLNLTQSAVSARIAGLEEEFGILLIDRQAKGFRLTWAGERFLSHAEQFLALQSRMRAELGGAAPAGFVLRLGAIESVLHSWLVSLIRAIKHENPRVELEITVEMTPVLNHLLRRGALDLVFSAAPAPGSGLRARALPPAPMCFIGPAAMAGQGRLELHEVCARELLTFQRGSHPHVALEESLARQGAADKRLHCLSSIAALAQLVEGGFGLATLPRFVARNLARRYGITILDTVLDLAPLPIHAAFRDLRDNPGLSRAIETAIDFATAEQTPA